MKSVKLFRLLILSGLICFGVACSDDDDEVQPPNNNNNNDNGETISAQIAATTGLDSLEIAIAQVGFNTTLQSSGNHTFFAPSNQAFQQLLSDQSVQRVSHLADAAILDLLQYHLSSQAEYKSNDLNGRMYIESTNTGGPDSTKLSIQVNGSGGSIVLNGEATISEADIDASNGVLHVIDNYIDKPTILNFLETDGRFDSLLILVRNNNLDYESRFSTGTKTLFAPDNQSFSNYISSEGAYNQMSDIPFLTIPSILDYHYINNTNIRSNQMTQDQNMQTKQGNSLTVDLTNGLQLETTNNGQSNVNVSETDIQATNGVIHRVDAVLKY
ncbi:MAG: fasciclin domain-containing protein [Vicingaceae bacterium]